MGALPSRVLAAVASAACFAGAVCAAVTLWRLPVRGFSSGMLILGLAAGVVFGGFFAGLALARVRATPPA